MDLQKFQLNMRVTAEELRRRLRDWRPDLLVEDINKIPFYTPLYAGGVPVVAVVPHLFGATAFLEASLPVAACGSLGRTVGRLGRSLASPPSASGTAIRPPPTPRRSPPASR